MVGHIIVKLNGKAVTTWLIKSSTLYVIYPKFKSLATTPKQKFRVPATIKYQRNELLSRPMKPTEKGVF
jgi:hypothetical protein